MTKLTRRTFSAEFKLEAALLVIDQRFEKLENQTRCDRYLPSKIQGKHYYLYLIMDIFSRKVVGAEVYDRICSGVSPKNSMAGRVCARLHYIAL